MLGHLNSSQPAFNLVTAAFVAADWLAERLKSSWRLQCQRQPGLIAEKKQALVQSPDAWHWLVRMLIWKKNIEQSWNIFEDRWVMSDNEWHDISRHGAPLNPRPGSSPHRRFWPSPAFQSSMPLLLAIMDREDGSVMDLEQPRVFMTMARLTAGEKYIVEALRGVKMTNAIDELHNHFHDEQVKESWWLTIGTLEPNLVIDSLLQLFCSFGQFIQGQDWQAGLGRQSGPPFGHVHVPPGQGLFCGGRVHERRR